MNIYDIAKKANVSIATVSRVINNSGPVSEKTRQRVNEVMAELGYSPNIFARGLMINSIKTIGVLTIDVQDLYHASAIHTIEVEARLKDYDTILCSTGENINDKKKYLKLLLQKRVDGIILIGSVFKEKTDNSHIIEAASHVPVVMINGYVKGPNIYSIICNDSQAVYEMVLHLASKGHKKIIYVYDAETYSGWEKIKGFKKGMKAINSPIGKNNIIKTEKGIEGGYIAAQKLLDQKADFTAVITSEDIIASGMIKVFNKSGLSVPGDIAVAGFNNSIIALCTTPELTSVDNKINAISSSAAKFLIDAIEGKDIPSKTIVEPQLVIRNST